MHLLDSVYALTRTRQNSLGFWDFYLRNAQRKGNLQILGHLGSWHLHTSGDERKNLEKVSQENQKATQDKTM